MKNLRIVPAVILLLFAALVITLVSLNPKKPETAPAEATVQTPVKIQIPEAPPPPPPPPPPVAVNQIPKTAEIVPPVFDPAPLPKGGSGGPPASQVPTPDSATTLPPVSPPPPGPRALVGEQDLVDAIPANSPPSHGEKAQESQADASAQLSPTKSTVHKVVRGDTLSGISRAYRVEPSAIQQANQMKNDVIILGAELVIPQP